MDNTARIINQLGKHPTEAYTMHELSKILHIPYATFYRTVQRINDLINITPVGKAKTITLKNNDITHAQLTIASHEEKKAHIKSNRLIKHLNEELPQTKDIILLFGSYAKGKETPQSDIDIMIINKKGESDLQLPKFTLLHDKEVNIMTFTEKEYASMLKGEEENVGKQALKGHIVLNNPKRFWELVLNALR